MTVYGETSSGMGKNLEDNMRSRTIPQRDLYGTIGPWQAGGWIPAFAGMTVGVFAGMTVGVFAGMTVVGLAGMTVVGLAGNDGGGVGRNDGGVHK